MIERLIDRLPALLLLAVVLLAVQVALVETGDPARLLPAVPAALLLLLYLVKGKGAAKGRGGKGKGARSAAGGEE